MRLFAPKFITVFNFLILYLAAVADSDKLKTTTSRFGTFTSSDHDHLLVTPDTANPIVFNPTNRSGRVLLRQKFKLFESGNRILNTTRVASFNSSFLINISPTTNTSKGEGLAFIVVPNLDVPIDSYGEYLGLTNFFTDGDSSNKFVAVEFDTRKQWFDPDDNHLGLNINSVRSVETIRLSPRNIDFAPTRFYNVWINYDGVSKTLEVYMAEQFNRDDPTPMIPSYPLLRSNLDLSNIVEQYSYFGFSASTGNATQLNCVLRWNMTVEYFVEKEIPWLIIGLGAGIPAAAVVVVMAAICWYWWRMRRGSDRNIAEGLMRLPGMVREFEYEDLKKATGNFDDKFKLGEGIGRFEMEYENWVEVQNRQILELRSAVQTHFADIELKMLVDTVMNHYYDLFRMKAVAAKSDVLYLMSGMWKTSAERCFMWIGGFRPSDLLKVLVPHLDLLDQQLLQVCGLKQCCQQAEDALSQVMDKFLQILADNVAADQLSQGSYNPREGNAMENLEALVCLVDQADHLRQETLRQMSRILTILQAAQGLLALGEYCHRLRALTSLWATRVKR